MPRLGGAPSCPNGGVRQRRPLEPDPGHGTGRGGMRSHLLRNSNAGEGGSGAWVGEAIVHLTSKPPPETPWAAGNRQTPRSPAAVGRGLLSVMSALGWSPINNELGSTARHPLIAFKTEVKGNLCSKANI